MSEVKQDLENLDEPVVNLGGDNIDTLPNAEIQRRLNALKLQKEALELELMTEQVAKIRSQKEQEKRELLNKVEATKQFMRQRFIAQANCNHKKGGIGAGAIVNGMGSSAHFCLIRHRLPIGRDFVLCQRCGGEWHPANPYVNPPTKATEGYNEMLRASMLTDNTPSAASMFVFSGTYPEQK